MSIRETIKLLQEAGTLYPYEPPGTRGLAKRRLYLTKDAEKARVDPDSATNIMCGRGYIEAALTRWVAGKRIYAERTVRFLTDLSPPLPEIWEIRVTEPRPQARLFGRFAEPNTLILTRFHTRDLLGAKRSQAWADAMADCVSQWDAFSCAVTVFSFFYPRLRNGEL